MTRDNRSDVWLQPLVISALQSNGRTEGAIRYAPLSQLETERAVLADVKREATETIERLSAIVDGDCTGCVDLEENKSGNCHDCSRRKDDMFRGKP